MSQRVTRGVGRSSLPSMSIASLYIRILANGINIILTWKEAPMAKVFLETLKRYCSWSSQGLSIWISPAISTSASAGRETTCTSRVAVRFGVNTPGRRTFATSFHVMEPPSHSNDAVMCDGISKEIGKVYVPIFEVQRDDNGDFPKRPTDLF